MPTRSIEIDLPMYQYVWPIILGESQRLRHLDAISLLSDLNQLFRHQDLVELQNTLFT